jgi:hypothetical protein
MHGSVQPGLEPALATRSVGTRQQLRRRGQFPQVAFGVFFHQVNNPELGEPLALLVVARLFGIGRHDRDRDFGVVAQVLDDHQTHLVVRAAHVKIDERPVEFSKPGLLKLRPFLDCLH